MFVSTNWGEALDLDTSLSILRDLALRHAELSGPYRDDIHKLLTERQWASLVAYEIDYERPDVSPLDILHARQALGFFQKLEQLDIGVDKEQVAFDKFIEAEALCSSTNALIRNLVAGRASVRPAVQQALLSAKRKIRGILGPCPALGQLKLRFGPGASTAIKRADANPPRKFASGLQCSTDALAFGLLPSLLRELPHWTAALESQWSIDDDGWLLESVQVEVVPGTLAFVPKSAKTYRSIVVEPNLNQMAQLGIGDYIGKRLRLAGVDIRDQSRNQVLALEGSLTGRLATIDLSSASDTISRELVRYLLPGDWFRLLSSFRTSTVQYKGEELYLEKFSSMGNGFTFPLETLLFYALVQSVCHDADVSVYGDDIICPAHLYKPVVEVLQTAGFVVNTSKSYASGSFRESCGRDYYKGINVRPFYQKHLVSGQSLFTLHNFYRRLRDDEGCALVKNRIPRSIRLYGPDGYGDGHLISDEWPHLYKKKLLERGYGGHFFETFSSTPRRWVSIYPGDWVSPLYSIYTAGESPLTDRIRGITERISSVDTSLGTRPRWALPGVEGYKKSLIYTLAR